MKITNFNYLKNKFQKKEVQELANNTLSDPVVSICVQTYQHVGYIKMCLDGILMQKTKFPFEILLGEDDSSDGTREICIEYAKNYPKKIRLFLHHRENTIFIDGKPTGRFNFLYNVFNSRGKYIALCEGDDYWTDPYKLQKQVDFLEANPDFSLCFHNVAQLNTFNEEKNNIIPGVKKDFVYTMEDYILSNRTATCSLVFKKELLGEIPSWFYKVPFGDLALILLVMYNSYKKGMVLKDTMGVYRIHENGIHGSYHKSNKSLIKAYKQHLQFNKIITSQFLREQQYKKVLFKKMRNTHEILANLYTTQNDKLGWFKSKLAVKYYSLLMKLN